MREHPQVRGVIRARRGERGAAAVEMAIVLPLLLLVLGGIVDIGRAYMTQEIITNAAREGARAAVIAKPTNVGVVTSRVQTASPGIPSASLTIAVTGCSSGGGGDASVTVSVPSFRWIFVDAAVGFFGGSLAAPTISATSVMRCGG